MMQSATGACQRRAGTRSSDNDARCGAALTNVTLTWPSGLSASTRAHRLLTPQQPQKSQCAVSVSWSSSGRSRSSRRRPRASLPAAARPSRPNTGAQAQVGSTANTPSRTLPRMFSSWRCVAAHSAARPGCGGAGAVSTAAAQRAQIPANTRRCVLARVAPPARRRTAPGCCRKRHYSAIALARRVHSCGCSFIAAPTVVAWRREGNASYHKLVSDKR